MKPIFSIIIPSYNNPDYLTPCVLSIMRTGVLQGGIAELIIVNNGKQKCKEEYGHMPGIKVIDSPMNAGWEGGLRLGLEASDTPFVCFQNDDTFIPPTCSNIYSHLLSPFSDKNVSAVGPSTTVAAGVHSIYRQNMPQGLTECGFLIFFTVMVRRSDLMAVGSIDETLPGGDDLDLSIRFRKAGKKVVFNPNAFIIHHGFKTGERVKGGPDRDMGWNSRQMSEATNIALIRKHGFKMFLDTMNFKPAPYGVSSKDSEGDIVRELAKDSSDILEMACGYQKTVSNSTGIDRVPFGEVVPHGEYRKSVADITGDVSQSLPFPDEKFDCIIARHILEHCLDPIKTLKNWARVLKLNGKLIIAVPNQEVVNGIALDSTHVHGFDAGSLNSILEACGFSKVVLKDPENGISFVACYEKSPVSKSFHPVSEVVCSE